MVGAYDWDGGVLKEGINGRIVPPREAFESEFPLELKNHAAYLGTDITDHWAEHSKDQSPCVSVLLSQCYCVVVWQNWASGPNSDTALSPLPLFTVVLL